MRINKYVTDYFPVCRIHYITLTATFTDWMCCKQTHQKSPSTFTMSTPKCCPYTRLCLKDLECIFLKIFWSLVSCCYKYLRGSNHSASISIFVVVNQIAIEGCKFSFFGYDPKVMKTVDRIGLSVSFKYIL